MDNIYFLKFNNYHNRILKVFDTVEEYRQYETIEPRLNANFNPASGFETFQEINCKFDEIPDYVVVEHISESTETENTLSRWFVISDSREAKNYYTLGLRRDVKADFKDVLFNSPAFIRKGTMKTTNFDIRLFNKENIAYNQIKDSEIELSDHTGIPWIIGYIQKDAPKQETTITIQEASGIDVYKDYNDWSAVAVDFPWISSSQKIANVNLFNSNESTLKVYPFGFSTLKGVAPVGQPAPTLAQGVLFKGTPEIFSATWFISNQEENYVSYSDIKQKDSGSSIKGSFNLTRNRLTDLNALLAGYEIWFINIDEMKNALDAVSAAVNSEVVSSSSYYTGLKGIIDNALSSENIDSRKYIIDIDQYSNKEVKVGENFYRILITQNPKNVSLSVRYSDVMKGLVSSFVQTTLFNGKNFAYVGNNSYYVDYRYTETRIEFQEITNLPQIKTTFKIHTEREITQGVAYDMFAIPFGGKWSGGSTNKEEIMKFITMLSATKGTHDEVIKLIDAQILPYCPIDEIKVDGSGNLVFGGVDVQNILDGDDNVIGKICWCKKATFSRLINKTVTVSDYKESNELDYYRICSPNFTSNFEFSPAKNNGVDYFEAECTYMPGQPYMRVHPYFKGFYGTNFKDVRGLILSGDYSLPMISDAWTDYIYANKNYEQIFNKQIQSMEFNKQITLEQSAFNLQMLQATGGLTIAASSIGGGVAGAKMGAAAGPWGAVAGGVAGAAGGAILSGVGHNLQVQGAEMDYQQNIKIANYNIDLAKSNWNLSMANIQALPYSISKSSPLNSDFRYFPILEKYTCSNEERLNFRDMIKYNGITINKAGYFKDYITKDFNYIEGTIYQFTDDFHESAEVANAIIEEANKGFYIIE